MRPGITNIYVTTSECSTLVVESTKPLGDSINKTLPHNYEIVLDGPLIMASDTIHVYDGLVDTITVAERYNKSIVTAHLEYPSSYQIRLERGVPEKLMISFDWSFLKSVLYEKVVVIDPGHGGKDLGYRGYINLLEKNVVVDIANYLKKRLNFYGANAVLTREKDVDMKLEERMQTAALLESEIYVGLHTNWDSDKTVNGAKGTYQGEKGKMLCEAILKELGKKPRLQNLGISQDASLARMSKGHHITQIPYVNIEVCTISNPVEEGWLRSSVFKERLAAAIMNGIVSFMVQNDHTNTTVKKSGRI